MSPLTRQCLLNKSGINHRLEIWAPFWLLWTKKCMQKFKFFAYLSMLMATRLKMDEVLQMTSSDMWKSQRILGNLQRPQLTCKKGNMCDAAKRFYFFIPKARQTSGRKMLDSSTDTHWKEMRISFTIAKMKIRRVAINQMGRADG